MTSSFAFGLLQNQIHVRASRPKTATVHSTTAPVTAKTVESTETKADIAEGFVGSHMPAPAQTASATSAALKAAYIEGLFESITKTFDFEPAWHNGTGYFNAAVEPHSKYAVKISTEHSRHSMAPHELAKSVDATGRKLIFIGTTMGPILVFQRYSGAEGTYCMQVGDDLRKLGYRIDGSLQLEQLQVLFGALPELDLQARLDCPTHDSEIVRQMTLRAEAFGKL